MGVKYGRIFTEIFSLPALSLDVRMLGCASVALVAAQNTRKPMTPEFMVLQCGWVVLQDYVNRKAESKTVFIKYLPAKRMLVVKMRTLKTL